MQENLQTIIEKEMVSLEGSQLTGFRARMNDLLGQVERMEITSHDTYASGGDLVKIISNDLKKLNEQRMEDTKKPRQYVDWVNAEFKKITAPLVAADKAARTKMKTWADEEEARLREEERKAREKAEAEALAAAEKAAEEQRKAEEAARKAREEAAELEAAGKAEEAAAAQEAADKAAQEAVEHEAESEAVMDAAANAPVVDPTVKKARGSFGATSGMKKIWKCEVQDVMELLVDGPISLAGLACTDPKVVDAVRIAVQKAAINLVQMNPDKKIPGLKVWQDSQVAVR